MIQTATATEAELAKLHRETHHQPDDESNKHQDDDHL